MAKISEVLHLAADRHLCPKGDAYTALSCCAVDEACFDLGVGFDCVEDGLIAMGCPTGSLNAFHEFPAGPERQAARYSWLKFAALIAEEQESAQ